MFSILCVIPYVQCTVNVVYLPSTLRCYGRIVFKLYVFIAYHPGCTRV